MSTEPFRVAVPDAVLADLKERLGRARYPTEPRGPAWSTGTDGAWMRQVVEHWRTRYDWRKWEAEINRFPNHKATIGGKKVHFIMEQGSGANSIPLILTHGWPGSIVEFLQAIEPLAHPERFGGDAKDGFTVVVPSLPGYGFSDPPDAPITPRDVAGMWSELMTKTLAFPRYFAQGGDWGGIVTGYLGRSFPERLAAMHLNMLAFTPSVSDSGIPVTVEEKAWLEASAKRREGETGYQQIQGTKPTTLAYGLTDSPAGLAAWILEKFHGWTVPGSPNPPPFDLDRLLTNVMLYWLAGPNAASWLYFSLVRDADSRKLGVGEKVQVPTGMMLMPNDLTMPAPESWVRRMYARLDHFRIAPMGGHFPAFEQPEVFVEEVRGFFRGYR